MAVLKCKMCGGNIEFEPGATVGVCDSCGTRQTLPRLDDDRKNALLDRANHFRRSGEFDKAAALYEQLLTEGAADAEISWSLVLCRYGIQYVEDPVTKRQIPTVNRAQYTPVTADADYKQTLAHADEAQKELYEAEAREIDEIQKGILAVSQKEEPFDVFICYKETDENGRRTQDSVLANELYYALTEKGFKVFFARITLEDKLGSAYEPYIFAALNSAKVMVVLGTKSAHFNAVWVKNEWSRFLLLIKQGKKKMLIPAYRDMDPYDLPDEFATLQAQDMSKLGFVQDLVRGIEKITGVGAEQKHNAAMSAPTVTMSAETAGTLFAMLDRGFLSLEDGEFETANAFFENALNFDARCARAYFGKMMAANEIKTPDDLNKSALDMEADKNYQKAVRFADEKLAAELKEYAAKAAQNLMQQKQAETYREALDQLAEAKKTERGDAYQKAAVLFAQTPGYKEADTLAEQCRAKANGIWYTKAERLAKTEIKSLTADMLGKAAEIYERLGDYRDAPERAARCRREQTLLPAYKQARHEIYVYETQTQNIRQINAVVAALEKAKGCRDADVLLKKWQQFKQDQIKLNRMIKKITLIALAIIAVFALVLILIFAVIRPAVLYNAGQKAMDAGDYVTAYQNFSKTNHKDSEDQKKTAEAKVIKQVFDLFSKGEYDRAGIMLHDINAVALYQDVLDKKYASVVQTLQLTTFTVPAGETTIATGAFKNCTSLTSITIPDSVTSIGNSAFYGCTHLTSVAIPNSVTSIGNSAFFGCTHLTSVAISDGVIIIGEGVFRNCTGLTSVTIPNSVTSIGPSAFSGCSSLVSMTIPFVGFSRRNETQKFQYPFGYIFGTNSYTGGVATTQYYYCDSSMTYTTYYIPSTLCFVTVTDGNILPGAFYNCANLMNITLDNKAITSIGEYAFQDCIDLTSINIPCSVTSINFKAFYGCTDLNEITFEGTKAQWNAVGKGDFWNSNTGKYTIHCVDGNIAK